MDLVDDADLVTSKKSAGHKESSSRKSSPTPSPSSSSIQQPQQPQQPQQQQPPPTPAVAEINMAGLSARERNMLKRKMKNDAKMNKNKEK